MCLFIRQNAQISIIQGQENQIPQQINKNCGLNKMDPLFSSIEDILTFEIG